MRGETFGLVVGVVALLGAFVTLAVLSSVFRRSSCAVRLVVIGAAVALVWKAMIAFSTPRWIDEPDGLLVLGLTVVFARRLWIDTTGSLFNFLEGGPK